MTTTEFENYQKISNKIIQLLIDEGHSSLADIKIIYNIIMGFPFCLSENGQYTYCGNFYNSFDDLPIEAKEDVLCNAYKLKCLSFYRENELPKLRKNNYTI